MNRKNKFYIFAREGKQLIRKIVGKIRKKRKSKNILWKFLFYIKDSFFGINLKKEYFMEKNLKMRVKVLLQIMQRESFKSTYFGIPAIKSPLDFWIYTEIIWSVQPDVIIDIGTRYGGTTLAMAHILDNIGKGKVISFDINHKDVPSKVKNHPRIALITGDACESFSKVSNLINKHDKVLIIEDSLHTYKNTLKILKTFSPLVTKNSYFIGEDSIINHGLRSIEYKSGGPYEAIEDFIKENDEFEVDRTKERFFITWNPKGYLRRIKKAN